jgi:selenocysteine lyase/cysteine desulfurase
VETVSIGASVSSLVAQAVSAVPDRSRVLLAEGEFTSVSFPFAAQAARGLVLDEVPLSELPDLAGSYDWVAVSVVQSRDGSVVDLAALRAARERSGVRVLLDVTQAAGWMPLDLGWADAVVGAGYKWLLSPKGAAWLAVSAEVKATMVPSTASYYASDGAQSMYGLPLSLRDDARRFDASPAWFAHVGAAQALPWLASLDLHRVRDHCVGMADRLRAGLGLPPAESAILAVEGGDAERLRRAGVAASSRAGRTRLACHLYTTEEDVAAAIAALA